MTGFFEPAPLLLTYKFHDVFLLLKILLSKICISTFQFSEWNLRICFFFCQVKLALGNTCCLFTEVYRLDGGLSRGEGVPECSVRGSAGG